MKDESSKSILFIFLFYLSIRRHQIDRTHSTDPDFVRFKKTLVKNVFLYIFQVDRPTHIISCFACSTTCIDLVSPLKNNIYNEEQRQRSHVQFYIPALFPRKIVFNFGADIGGYSP